MIRGSFLSRTMVALIVGTGAVALATTALAGGGGQAIPVAPKAPAKAQAKPAAKTAPGSELFGEWEVTRVLVDLADQPRWSMRPNNPELLYRSMTIDAHSVRLVRAEPCAQTSWQPLTTTWRGLFHKSRIMRRTREGRDIYVEPKDFDLDVQPAQRVRAYLACPDPKQPAGRSWQHGVWMALQTPDTLVVRYDDGQALIVLQRRAPGSPPRASFPCEQASTATQKAICSDVELAAWDRSVAAGLRRVLDYKDGEDKAKVLRDQMAWQAERDRCGGDRACIEEQLFFRVERLNQL